MITKTCSSCRITKPTTEFRWRTKNVVLQSNCKSCAKTQGHAHYMRNKAKVIAKSIAFNKRAKKAYQELLMQFQCIHCSENDPCCFDFHHLDPTQKDGDVSTLASKGSSEKLWKEIAKCVVLCANCHRKFHKGRFSLTPEEINKFQQIYAVVCPLSSKQEKG